jgi:catechol 2,3-dioxygenase-like lactoylglutathione lyase family enzyme
MGVNAALSHKRYNMARFAPCAENALGHNRDMEKISILGSAKVGTFICTRDRAKAKTFYGGTLGLELQYEDDYAVVFDIAGTTLRISTVDDLKPQPFTVLGWSVSDVPATVRALHVAGVAFERFDGMEQDELGIWSPGGTTRVAWFKDPDGNLLSISNG